MNAKLLFRLIVVFGLLIIPLSIASANNDSPRGKGNTLDPNYKWSPEELARMAEKEKEAKIHAQISLTLDYNQQLLYVGSADAYRELYEYEYRNYCGPTSTQVAIRARTSDVPDVEDVAIAEELDPDWGIWIDAITPYINDYLNTNWYVTDVAGDSTELGNWIEDDVDSGYAPITGTVTDDMPGWTVDAEHILAVYGYNYSNPTKYVYYADTGSETAGHYYSYGGAYFNSISLDTFWSYVSPNNVQVW